MSEEKTRITITVDTDLAEKVDQRTKNRSEFFRESARRQISATASDEQRLEEIEEKIEETEEEIEDLERKKRMLEIEKDEIESQLEQKKEEIEAYNDLVAELAERKADGYQVLDSTEFERAVSLSNWSGELAVQKVLDEVREQAGIEDAEQEQEVVVESSDDYEFDIDEINTGDEQ